MIRFNSLRARDFLLRNGYVYTLRYWQREDSFETTAVGGGEPIGRVRVTYVTEVPLTNMDRTREVLGRYVNESGFGSVEEWVGEFRRLNRGRRVRTAHLYRVVLIKAMRR